MVACRRSSHGYGLFLSEEVCFVSEPPPFPIMQPVVEVVLLSGRWRRAHVSAERLFSAPARDFSLTRPLGDFLPLAVLSASAAKRRPVIGSFRPFGHRRQRWPFLRLLARALIWAIRAGAWRRRRLRPLTAPVCLAACCFAVAACHRGGGASTRPARQHMADAAASVSAGGRSHVCVRLASSFLPTRETRCETSSGLFLPPNSPPLHLSPVTLCPGPSVPQQSCPLPPLTPTPTFEEESDSNVCGAAEAS